MAWLVLDPLGFWLSLLLTPAESAWGQLGRDWREGRTVLCLSPGVMAMYMGPIQGPEAIGLGLDDSVLARIGWLLRQRGEWYQPAPGPTIVGEPWDKLAWLVAAAKPDALLIADPALSDWPQPLGVPILTDPAALGGLSPAGEI